MASLLGTDGSPRWHTVEATPAVRALVEGVDVDGTTAEQAAAQALRGHLEVASPLTHGALVGRTGLPSGRVTIALAALEAEGFAIQGRFTERAVDAGDDPALIEWSSRRLLTRIHAYSCAQRRRRVEPITAEQLMRFLAVVAARHRGAYPPPRRRRAGSGDRAAAGLRDRRRGVGVRGAGPPGARRRPRLARPPLPPG